MDKTVYIECARAITSRIREEINGIVRTEIYPEIDSIVVKIKFKEFDFNYGVKDIQDLMISDGIQEAVDELLRKYKKAILNGFFKSEARKERDRMGEYSYGSVV